MQKRGRRNRRGEKARRGWDVSASVSVSLATVRAVARTRLVPGAVVWAHIPYMDCDGEKGRPAVVVGRTGREVVLFPATTSSSRFRHPHKYVEIDDLAAAGLRRPTGVRLSSVTVDIIDVISIVGSLADDDRAQVSDSSSDFRCSPVTATPTGGDDVAA